MNIFSKSVIDTCSLIEETSSVENAYVDSIYDQEVMNMFINTLASLDELEEDGLSPCVAMWLHLLLLYAEDGVAQVVDHGGEERLHHGRAEDVVLLGYLLLYLVAV